MLALQNVSPSNQCSSAQCSKGNMMLGNMHLQTTCVLSNKCLLQGKTPREKAEVRQAVWAQQPAITLADLMDPEGMKKKPVRDYNGVFAALRNAH